MKSLLGVFIFLFVVAGALAGGLAAGYFASLVDGDIPSQEVMAEEVTQYSITSTAHYADGSLISELRSDLVRTPTTIDKVSPEFIDALVAVEDEYFLEHEGIVPKAIVRAMLQEFTGSESQTGGSTLTQQVIKQQLLSNEATHKRKVNEILLALRLENFMDKEQILEAYINVSPFGRNNRGQNIAGIQEATEGIFGIQPDELNLPQAAFIAGLPQSPIAYSPYNQDGSIKEDLSRGLARKDIVLFNMYREDYITLEEFEEARDYDLEPDFIPRQEDEDGSERQFYVYDLAEKEARDIIINQIIETSDYSPEEVQEDNELAEEIYNQADTMMRSQGIKIYTTIDKDLHTAINQAAQAQIDSLGSEKTITYTNSDGETVTESFPIQLGATVIENETGRVLAFVGGRDYDYSNYNIPFDSRRSSGSTLKPLVAYGPALAEHIITPQTVIPDTPFSVPSGGGTHAISNYGETTNQWRPAEDWLPKSQNIPASRVFMELLENDIDVEQYVRRLGLGQDAISSDEFNNPSLALGGVTHGPTVTELTAAYAALANNGVFNPPHVIDRIEDANGNVLYETSENNEPSRVWSEASNYLLVDMLRGVTHSDIGTGSEIPGNLQFDADLLSKSGTSSEYKDVWFVGSTPNVSLGTWLGYNNQNISVEYDYGVHPSVRTRRLWANLLNTIYQTNADLIGLGEEFYMPEDKLTTETISTQTGMKTGRVELPDGKVVNLGGPTTEALFDAENVPGTTVYDFTVQATSSELDNFWSGRANRNTRGSSSNTNGSSSGSSSGGSDGQEDTDDDQEDGQDQAGEEENAGNDQDDDASSIESTLRNFIDSIIGGNDDQDEDDEE